ncbi:GntR family transcriptional regulator [Isoptericola variabilis]|uniref:Transcriptional regulator, GntR family n=1 Tax=Isoptericola variabilis (strain 225) TaxID=743718 RepID=F6FQX4_ISOV2|nr:GntR family transcriptional regulator [Isoptericola variabilis]AEG43859.1 transcriptional regulator, GntR family [Isoptericola variabilis 225]TWH34165.1 GntR family transcriptional regulator [Isoptericola variabilis J7]
MLWRIDPASDEPLYAQLVAQAHLAAARGELAPGDRLPAARELAESLELNVHTVLKAYQQLRDEGLIELRRGRGAVVTAAAARDLSPVEAALAAFVTAAREARLSPEATTTLVKEAMKR